MMKNLLLILCFFPMLVLAQEEDQSKYMVGAVPEVNGKVVFSQEINAPNLSKDQIFDAILAWANTRFKTDKGNWGMVAYSNKEEGQIACYGNEYIVFAGSSGIWGRDCYPRVWTSHRSCFLSGSSVIRISCHAK